MSCNIVLNNAGILGPGASIIGKVVCTFNTQEHIRGVICKLRGREQTHWVERRGKHNVHFSGSNDFLRADTLLMGESNPQPGVYEYQFNFKLPPSNIPSSYSHEYGSIRYFVQAYVDRPFAFDYKDEITFQVASLVTFSVPHNYENVQPVTYQVDKEVGCCCSVGLITMNVTLEREAYVLGEVVKVKVEIDNKTNVEIQGLDAKLSTNILFTTRSPSSRTKKQKVPIALVNDSGVGAYKSRTYNLNLKIPETVILQNFTGTALFKQWCAVTVEALLPPVYRDLKLHSNIKLGHIGFGINVPQPGSATNVVSTGEAPPVSLAPTAPRNLDEDFTIIGGDPRDNSRLPPPSYDDVMNEQKKHGPPRT